MNRLARYIIIIAVIVLIAFIAWYFSNIVAYVLIAGVLSLIGRPLVDFLDGFKIGKWKLPRTLCAAFTLLLIWVFFILFFSVFIPLIVSQVNSLSVTDLQNMLNYLNAPMQQIDAFIAGIVPGTEGFSLQQSLIDLGTTLINHISVSNVFGSVANFLRSTLVGAFAVSFITFFFLRDDNLFFSIIIVLFPKKYESNVSHALDSVKNLLVRYFVGMFCDMLCILLLVTLGLTFIGGLDFNDALVIGLIAAILNVIPYVGPIIGACIGLTIGVVTHLELLYAGDILPLLLRMALVFLSVQVIDASLLQPYIYSNSVKAHPLEIFIVILIAGSLAGIFGMLLAIPTYTVLRVFAKEFFNNFRLIQKLTQKI